MPENNDFRPGRDSKIDGGHLMGEARKSTGVLAAISGSRALSLGKPHALLGSIAPVTLSRDPRNGGDFDRDDLYTGVAN